MSWVLTCTVHLTVCSYHVVYAIQSESTLCSCGCTHVKELLTRNRRKKFKWSIENCIRKVKSLKIESSTCGCLNIPPLKKIIKDKLSVITFRKFPRKVWTLEHMSKYLNYVNILDAKEICFSFANISNEKERIKKKNRAGYTASGLHNESSENYESKIHKYFYWLENHNLPCAKRWLNRQSQTNKHPFSESKSHSKKLFCKTYLQWETSKRNGRYHILFVIQEKTKLIMCRKMAAQIVFKSSHQRCSVKKDALKNFENFTGKHLDSLFNKVADSFIKKRLKNRCFAAKFSNF